MCARISIRCAWRLPWQQSRNSEQRTPRAARKHAIPQKLQIESLFKEKNVDSKLRVRLQHDFPPPPKLAVGFYGLALVFDAWDQGSKAYSEPYYAKLPHICSENCALFSKRMSAMGSVDDGRMRCSKASSWNPGSIDEHSGASNSTCRGLSPQRVICVCCGPRSSAAEAEAAAMLQMAKAVLVVNMKHSTLGMW